MSTELGPIQKNEIQLNRLPRLSGKRYLLYGASLMGFKYIIDVLFSTLLFHRPWTLSEYWVPGSLTHMQLLTSGTAEGAFFGSMLLISLPFAFLGSLLTLRRLKAIGLPPWLVTLFYVPFLNMIFFIILTVVESRPSLGDSESQTKVEALGTSEQKNMPVLEQSKDNHVNTGKVLTIDSWSTRHPAGFASSSMALKTQTPREEKFLALMDKLPQDGFKAILAAAALPVPIAVLAALFSVLMLGTYGWSIFTAIPFIASIAASILYGWRKQRSLLQCISVSITSLLIMASILLVIPFEGIICLLMAAPLAVGIGTVGGAVGYVIQANLPRSESMPRLLTCFAIVLPLLMIGEYITPADVPLYENVSTIEIAAPPSLVWKYLIDFPPMGAPTDWVFKTGIAYPIRAKIEGHGVGAVRHCIFTTGEFVEPINIWDEPHTLRFGVQAQAPPMHELSLYPDLHPAHLDNYLVARQGQFLLKEDSPGHTKLSGTTWYQNYMGPSPYWRLWSDWIIHRIHMRVLCHVKALAEDASKKQILRTKQNLPAKGIPSAPLRAKQPCGEVRPL